ncbi:MAG: TadE/TadG family type IV pilus assembly protein [Pseudomonadota bacterium]
MPSRLSRSRRAPGRQGGVAAIELAVCALVLLTFLGTMLQVARALWYYNALAKATGDAALYLANAPTSELNSAGLATARNLVVLAAQGAGFALPSNQVLITCSPAGSAPCAGAATPTAITVKANVYCIDSFFLNITFVPPDVDFSNINVTARTTMPRVGYW